jgi:hypothetical protein
VATAFHLIDSHFLQTGSMMDVGPGLEATANRLWTTPNRQRSERIRVHGKKERHSQTASGTVAAIAIYALRDILTR